eukprot:TRINITY_DN1678_c0_g1_i5.p1 TRINITY_DN1678_c0_g1~~TRINITY_DN1678_c0_g1_i5.p1  ORF type:complete len:363 (+),score=100.98 TRINITY_DN1678_c0_g1_i5:436-1524(+)
MTLRSPRLPHTKIKKSKISCRSLTNIKRTSKSWMMIGRSGYRALGRLNHISYEDLTNRFSRISYNINSLLAAEAPIKILVPDRPEKIALAAGLKCHYKVLTKDQPIPLKLKFAMYKGSLLYLSLSQPFPRPDRNNNDKLLLIASKESCLTYNNDNPRAKFFTIECVYVTLECDKEAGGVLRGEFGSRKKTVREKESQAQSTEEEKTERKQLKEFKVRAPVLVKLVQEKDYNAIKTHRKIVLLLRDKRENEYLASRTILMNKKRVSEWYDLILKEKSKSISRFKQMLVSWISLAKTFKIAFMLYGRAETKVSEKRMTEHRTHNGMTIKVILTKIFTDYFGSFKEQLHGKLDKYFPFQPIELLC